MGFYVVRLGKDSIPNIKAITANIGTPKAPLSISVVCAQVPAELQSGDFAFIWLGSDNAKGLPPAWKMGFRALAEVTNKINWSSYSAPATVELSVGVIFADSVDQVDFLDRTSSLYSHFAEMPVVGPRSRSNQTVLKIDDSHPRQSVPALIAAMSSLLPAFSADVTRVYPQIAGMIGKAPAGAPAPLPGLSLPTPHLLPKEGALNKIIIGAPGTGKSRLAEMDPAFQRLDALIRTVFHPDYTYSDFIGSYQPMAQDDGRITYKFVPGPFTNALVRALTDEAQAYCLLIEEINRGNAAAIFGDVFQLLDRDDKGESIFKVDPDPRLAQYLTDTLGWWAQEDKIYLPSNLWLVATMNTSDQGLQFMDSAFKRRWLFHYLPIDFEACPWKDNSVAYAGKKYPWKDFGSAINSMLQAYVPEDRLIGPAFLTPSEISDPDKVASKLLFYLWNDVLRHAGQEKLFIPQAQGRTFSGIMAAFLSGKEIFVPELGKLLAGKEK